jgi:iron complex transport system substrate-binding protein
MSEHSASVSRAARTVAVLAAATMALTACAGEGESAPPAAGGADTIVVEHAQGKTEIPANPQTVLTFDLASLDTLDALGVEVAGLPTASLPDYLSEYADDEYLKVGSLFEPDYEAVAAAEPDLIIVAARSAAVLPELQKIAPTIDLTMQSGDYYDSFAQNVTTLGEIFGKEAEAADALAAIESKIADAQDLAADAGDALILNVSGGEISAFGPGSRYGWLHDELGVTPVIEDVEAATHGDPVSFEFVLEADPEWLFVIDRDSAVGTEDSASAQEVLDNELIEQTAAAKNDHIVYLSPVEWYIVMSGLTAVDRMVTEVSEALS